MNKYNVCIHYGTFITQQVEASDEDEALEKAREMPISTEEVMANLDEWLTETDDTATLVKEHNETQSDPS